MTRRPVWRCLPGTARRGMHDWLRACQLARIPRTTAATGALLVTALAAAGCGSSPSASAGASSTTGCHAPSVLTIGTFGPGVDPDSYVANGLGLFKKVDSECHTRVTFSIFQTPTTMISALHTGQIQFSVITAPNLILAANEHIQLTDLVNLAQGATDVLVGATKYAKYGTGLSALAKYPASPTWALNSFGGTDNLFGKALWAAAGQKSAPNFVAVGVNGTGPAVVSGKAALALVTSAAAGKLIAAGQAVEVLNASGPVAYKVAGFVPALGLTSTAQFAAQYPQAAELMVSAELQAMSYIKGHDNNPASIYKLLPTSFAQQETQSVWVGAWKFTQAAYTPVTGLITVKNFIALGELMKKYGTIPSFSPSVVNTTANATILKAAYSDAKIPYPTSGIDSAVMSKLAP